MPINIAILGATGLVGQKVIALLQDCEDFLISELVASDQRKNLPFNIACDWRELLAQPNKHISNIKLKSYEEVEAQYVISCLPSDIALHVEMELAKKGKIIFSNASAFRMHKSIPLLIPEINNAHLKLIESQETKGKIITNPNCSAVGVALSLAPLMALGQINHVSIVTLQSASGAGIPGVASMDLLNNTIPHINDEAEKITTETKKILGSINVPAPFAITTNVHRVPVLFGHTATLHISFANDVNIKHVFDAYKNRNIKYPNLYVLYEKEGRPQASRDLLNDDMRIHIGHLKKGDLPNIISLVVLSHNLVRGAAGAVIANLKSYMEYIKRR